MRTSQLVILSCFLLGCGSRPNPAPVYSPDGVRDRDMSALTGQKIYRVQRGDTLYSIAFRAGLDVRTLAELNQIADPSTIYVGQQLKLFQKAPRGTRIVGGTSTVRNSNKNHSNSDSSGQISKSTKVVAPQKQTRYGQVERVKESDEIPTDTFHGKVSQWSWPVQGPILAKFSSLERGNKGLDIGGNVGTPIRAAAAGQVVYAGNALRGYGNLVIIRHNDDFLSAYAHNNRLLVKERESVVAGQVIAEMGNSDADRVKLHFEIRFRGKSVDPLRYLK